MEDPNVNRPIEARAAATLWRIHSDLGDLAALVHDLPEESLDGLIGVARDTLDNLVSATGVRVDVILAATHLDDVAGRVKR